MRCVSYTRAMSNDSVILPIMEQNDRITDYVRKKSLSISEKYSDRKHDPKVDDGFYTMKQDGISRKFDCVAFLSMRFFGGEFLCANDLLSRVFIPAGIQFISVEDDYCSFEHSKKEVMRFLQDKMRRYIDSAHPVSIQYSAGVKRSEKTVFGYLRIKDENRLIIDPVAEPVVKEIFKLALEGMTYSKISALLNQRGVISNVSRLNQIYGKTENPMGYSWKNNAILKILNNPAYSGSWTHIENGETVTIPCPAYITKEQQEQIRLMTQRKKIEYSRTENYLKNLVFDKESGNLLRAQYSDKMDGQVYRFFRKQKKQMKQKTEAVSLSELNNVVFNRIKMEQKEAQQAVDFLNSTDGKIIVKETLKSFREPAKEKFKELVSVIRQITVSDNDPSEEDIRLLKRADEIESELETLAAECEPKRIIFSLDNPWIKLFVYFDETEVSSRRMAEQYIQKITFDRYGECDIELRLQEYKAPLMSLVGKKGLMVWQEKAEDNSMSKKLSSHPSRRLTWRRR